MSDKIATWTASYDALLLFESAVTADLIDDFLNLLFVLKWGRVRQCSGKYLLSSANCDSILYCFFRLIKNLLGYDGTAVFSGHLRFFKSD